MNDRVVKTDSGTFLHYDGSVYNTNSIVKGVKVGQLVRVYFIDGDTLDIPISLAKEIFFV